ncbi:MAG: hypothetical protein HFI34_09865 [Lachnospiraceae bacterium]|nr:hypothetical protein [Lachnospiraceae bacterium]
MKKLIVILAIAALYFVLIFNINQRFELNLNQFERWMRGDGNGTIYMVKNTEHRSDIVKLDRSDRMSLTASFHHNNGGQQVKITDMAVDNDDIYILFRFYATQSGKKKWKIIKYSVTDGKGKNIFETDKNIEIKRLSFREERLYLSVAAETEKVEIYEYDLRSEPGSMNLILERDMTEQPKDILYGTDDSYVLSCAGNVWSLGEGEPVRINGVAEGGCTAVALRDKTLFWYSQREHILYSGQGDSIKTEEFTVISMVGEQQGEIHILAAEKNGNILLYTLEDGILMPRTKTLNDSGKQKHAPTVWFMVATLIYFSAVFVIFLLSWGYGKSRHLAVRISMISVEMAAVLIAALTYSSYTATRDAMKGERKDFAALSNQIQISLLEEIRFGQIMEEKDGGNNDFLYTFYHSEDYRKLNVLFLDNLAEDSGEWSGSLQYLLYFDTDSRQSYFLGSGTDHIITGSSSGAVFSEKAVSLVCQSMEQNERISEVLETEKGTYSVTAAPLNRGTEPRLCLVTAVSMQDMGRKEKEAVVRLLTAALCILIITVVLLVISVQIALRPVRRLSKAMVRAAEGRIYEPGYKFIKIKLPEHEIGSMWVSFEKMCQALQKKNYKMEGILQSYYRFVPKKIEKLMNRDSVMKIQPGDMKYISGTVGMISADGEKELYGRNPAKQMKFINRCFRIINRNCEENLGILLSNDCNLSLVNILFPDSAEKAFAFGIDTIRVMAADGCRPVALLHKTSVLFGAAGTEEQIFPFVSSREIEELSRFIPELRKMGVRMAVTDSVIRKQRRGFSVRYIGYVVSESLNQTFQLYEMLEVYSEHEKNNRQKTDIRFQEGIQMFYQNDFYLARNKFSAVLKECPEDGIARWYLFTCEAMLNAGDFGEIRHNLFADI